MIKFLDIQKITESFEPELSNAIDHVVKRGWFLLGQEVISFEKEYASYIGSKHCIGVANGLDALRLIFKAYIEMGIMKEGDEVIVPANTFIATILAITDNRLKPVLVEPELNNYNLNISFIEHSITNRTRAVMIVHLYGNACWSRQLEEIAIKYKLKIIEDNAQAVGSIVKARGCNNNLIPKDIRTGSLGHVGGHSFYPGKNLGALGDGGAVTTDDAELATAIRTLANYGSLKKYVHEYKGLNSRLDEIQAAVLRVKLSYLDANNQRRREIAHFYHKNIKNDKIILPFIHNSSYIVHNLSHVWHLFVIRNANRDQLQKYLTKHDIQTLIHYPTPPHKQMAYKEWNHLNYPITEKIHNEVLSLPMSQVLEDSEIEYIVNCLNAFKV